MAIKFQATIINFDTILSKPTGRLVINCKLSTGHSFPFAKDAIETVDTLRGYLCVMNGDLVDGKTPIEPILMMLKDWHIPLKFKISVRNVPSLETKQWFPYIRLLDVRERSDRTMPEINGSKVIELFDKASKFLKYPHIRYEIPHCGQLKLQRLGPSSRFSGAVSISMDHGQIFYGYIHRHLGALEFRQTSDKKRDEIIKLALEMICFDPVNAAKINGQQYNHCCFCGLELTNSISVTHGYGPICAEKWGLPWSEESRDALKEEIERDEIADEVTHLLKDC